MWWNKKESFSFNFSFGRLEVGIGQQENIGIMVFFWMTLSACGLTQCHSMQSNWVQVTQPLIYDWLCAGLW